MANIMMKIIKFDHEKNANKYKGYSTFILRFDHFITIAFLTLFHHSCFILVLVVESFLLGLFLNLVFFIPHLATFSVVTFYSYSIWKYLEEKYSLLTLLIYEACEDNPVNRDIEALEKTKKLISVVSKELYGKIREKVLPYHTNLLWTGLKLLWLIVFTYTIYELVIMLQKFNITATVQLMVTASISILPLIINIMAGKINNEQTKDAWKKELKLKVKHMVSELTDVHQDLAKTFLIIGEKHVNNRENSVYFSAEDLSIFQSINQYIYQIQTLISR
jgi:hypothetical protein